MAVLGGKKRRFVLDGTGARNTYVRKQSKKLITGSRMGHVIGAGLVVGGAIGVFRGATVPGAIAIYGGLSLRQSSFKMERTAQMGRAKARMWDGIAAAHKARKSSAAASQPKTGIQNAGRVSQAYTAQKNARKVGSRGGKTFVKAHFRTS